MPADRPPPLAALANDRFRRMVGQDAGVRGRLTLAASLNPLTLRQRRAIIAAVRAYAFSADDGDQYAIRQTATVTVRGVAYRFRIEPEPGDDGAAPQPRLLIISRA